MAAPSVTYTFTNGTAADASQVNTNFTDLINGASDGTKDYSISALTVSGTATLNGNINLGNASSDDLAITASLASTLNIKTTASFDIGSASIGLRYIYFGNSTFTGRLGIPATATHTFDLPPTAPVAGKVVRATSTSASAWDWGATVTATTGTTSMAVTSDVYTMNSSGGAFTNTLPTAVGIAGKCFLIKKIGSDFGLCTIGTTSSQTIDGQLTRLLTVPNESIKVCSDGANWVILDRTFGDMMTYTPVGLWTTNSTYTGIYKKISPNEMHFVIKVALGGQPDLGSLTITNPNSWTADASLILGSGSGQAAYLGTGNVYDSSAANAFFGKVYYSSTTTVGLQVAFATTGLNPQPIGLSNAVTRTQPVTLASSDEIIFDYTLPISGWL